MNKTFLFMMFFVVISCLYICLFFLYLVNQYKRATIKYYKEKNNNRKYLIVTKEKYNNSKIKNNVTQFIDHELINSMVGYAMIEFIDEYERIIKTQTIFKPSLSIGREDSNDVVLRGQTISRFQCVIIYQNGDFYICNLSTSNPTLLNNVAIENTKKIFFGDVIKISNYKLRLQGIINNSHVG